MSLDLDMWTDSFCFCCDKQTTGEAYCSEACRLADFEKPATPTLNSACSSYTSTYMPTRSASPASPILRPLVPSTFSRPPARGLSPSSSHASLCSMDTAVAMGSSARSGISDAARKELQSYAKQFEHVRSVRRRSY